MSHEEEESGNMPVVVDKEKVVPFNAVDYLALIEIVHTSPLKGIVDKKIKPTWEEMQTPKKRFDQYKSGEPGEFDGDHEIVVLSNEDRIVTRVGGTSIAQLEQKIGLCVFYGKRGVNKVYYKQFRMI
jgi:hypothetical protein